MTFENLKLIDPILRALKEEGYASPTPIQEQSIPVLLQGKDLIGCAQTGTGKTAAFTIPILQTLYNSNHKKEIKALVLTPTRELAIQIGESFEAYGKYTGLRHTVIFGGVKQKQQTDELRRGSSILIATPGRLLDLIEQGFVSLKALDFFVLDEADRMLDMGFIPDIKRLVGRMPPNTDRQSLLFSATFNQDVMNLAYRWLHEPEFVEIEPEHKTSELVDQHFYLLTEDQKLAAVERFITDETVEKVIIFANRKDQVKRLYHKLRQAHKIVMLSGDVIQQKREKYLQRFKDGHASVLVATDVAGRGIHVDDVSHVINYTLPDQPDDYVHRIGRTGRAGQTGISISFVSEDDAFNIPALEKHLDTNFRLQQWQE